MGWGGLRHYANFLGDLELFFSSCPPSAQRRLSPPPARASSAHPAGHLRRRWGPRRQCFRSIPGVPRRGGRRPRESAKCKNRFPLRQWGAGGRPGPHWAQIAPLMPCRASAGQVAPAGVANGLRPGGGCSLRLREFSLLRPGARSFGGRSPVVAQRGFADLVGEGGRECGVHGRASGKEKKNVGPRAPVGDRTLPSPPRRAIPGFGRARGRERGRRRRPRRRGTTPNKCNYFPK